MESLRISCSNNVIFKSTINAAKVVKVVKNQAKSGAYAPVMALGSVLGIAVPSSVNPIKIREQAKKYNEIEKSELSLEEKREIEKQIAQWDADYNAKKAAERGEEYNAPTWEELQERRLPDFNEIEIGDDFFDGLNRINYTPVDMAEFKKEAFIIKDKHLRTIAEKICSNEQLTKSIFNYIRDIDAGLINITDSKVLKYLKYELAKLASSDYEPYNYKNKNSEEAEYFNALSNIGEVVDVYNTITGKYSRYDNVELLGADILISKSKPAEFIRNFRRYAPKKMENFIEILETGSSKKYPKVADFESSLKTEALELLTQNKEMLDYMYEKYYLSEIADVPTKKMCQEICQKYGVRVLLSEKTSNIRLALKVIRNELEAWTSVSGGKARLPKILDLNSCDVSYEGSSAYMDIRGNINHNGAKINTPRIIRHEIMHLNEPTMYAKHAADPETAQLIRSIIPSKMVKIGRIEKEVLDWDNCKYREEFLKAGINPEHIEYAYTNRNEFLAVAAEGDLSQYSPEFKQVLIKMGMPEFVFDLPVDDFGVEINVDRVEDILKHHQKASYDELVKFFEEKQAIEEDGAARLLKIIFGDEN